MKWDLIWRAMVLDAVGLVVVVFGLSVISLDGNREQEGFNRGAMAAAAGVAMVHAAASWVMVRRGVRMGRRGKWFVRAGGVMGMGVVLVCYFVAMSLLHGRVM